MQYYFIYVKFEKGTVKFEFCPTADILADGIIKLLPKPVFQNKRIRIGLTDVWRIRIATKEEC